MHLIQEKNITNANENILLNVLKFGLVSYFLYNQYQLYLQRRNKKSSKANNIVTTITNKLTSLTDEQKLLLPSSVVFNGTNDIYYSPELGFYVVKV